MRGLCYFLGFLLLLIGLQIVLTDRVFLTSQFTYAIAKQNPEVVRKTRIYQAFFGQPAPIPEKEIQIPAQAGYMTIFVAAICFAHGFGGRD